MNTDELNTFKIFKYPGRPVICFILFTYLNKVLNKSYKMVQGSCSECN